MRVLVVDDEGINLEILKELLSFIDPSSVTTFASSGQTAIAELRAAAFDLLVTDRKMTVTAEDGDFVASFAKEVCPSIRIIMLTGFGNLMNEAGELPRGVDLVVCKPITIEGLRQAITTVMAKNT